jgi:hypothetical protein
MALTMGRIGSKDFHEEAATGDFFDSLLNPLFFNMPFDIDEENIFPGFSPGGTRLNLGHAQAMRGEGPEQIV